LRILITNNTLAARAGSELYVRDLAIGLLNRGHTPIAYSTMLGEVADEIRAATVPVIDHLDALGAPPDVIHGHHHLDTMTALLHFPGVPAVYFCHGWLPWAERPPRFPRILQYVAVDLTCRDRLVLEEGISERRTRVLLNFVDLERFKPRGPLPSRPRRALVLSNYATERNSLASVRAACVRAGIKLDVFGLGVSKACEAPEAVLGNYDIVFAKGRAALEALAVGTAVILCNVTGAGPMVTTGDLARLRPLNFGIRTLRSAVTVEVLSREIARYDPSDAAEVSRQIRATAGLDAVLDQLIALYQEVIAESKDNPRPDLAVELHAAAAYLRRLTTRLKGRDQVAQMLEAQLAEKEQELARLAVQRTRLSNFSLRNLVSYTLKKL
jgi:glycosyltransferase involved in cell wall biosynthesis